MLRPHFDPLPSFDNDDALGALQTTSSLVWTPIISCSSEFPEDAFDAAIHSLITQPEQNSTLILRAEIVSDISYSMNEPTPAALEIPNMRVTRIIRRVLLPRRPGRDDSIAQDCVFYAARDHDQFTSCLVLTPLLDDGRALPYYHPAVHHLAFRCLHSTLRIEAVLISGTPRLTLDSRLYRTCLALLDTTHRYMWGHVSNWQKRVHHDQLVPRDSYQDLYIVMRERYKHFVQQWKEDTDPMKHVFEEIGIAVYLMLLWKSMYQNTSNVVEDPTTPWKTWPRPPGGFLDLGCGAGMLTHILVTEGYTGQGIDVRRRKSWDFYSDITRASLHVHALNPTGVLLKDWESAHFFPEGVFLIGNHSDELTPWLPVLSRLTPASGYLSIPCCPWTLDSKFERSRAPQLAERVNRLDIASLHIPAEINPSAGQSSYEAYRIWLGRLSLFCGWVIEADVLRIPSTRNWALVGRHTAEALTKEEAESDVRALVQEVSDKGSFVARGQEKEKNPSL